MKEKGPEKVTEKKENRTPGKKEGTGGRNERKLSRKEKKEVERIVREAKRDDGVPRTVQQSIPFDRAFRDGIIRVRDGYYTKTIEYEDINYQLAALSEKKSILEDWSGFLNFFDSSISFEFSFLNTVTDEKEFEESIRVPMAGDGFDSLRKEYNRMLRMQVRKGNNGLTKRKFLTFGIHSDSLKTAVPRLRHIQLDLINNFRQLGVNARVLSGTERLGVMHAMFHLTDPVPFRFSWKDMAEKGMSVKDFIAPDSFDFTGKRDFEMGDSYCAVSYLDIVAAQLPDVMLKDFLDMECGQVITIHVRALDQNAALKMVKHKITELDSSKIEEQKKAVRAGYDMDIIPSDLATYGRDAKSLLEQLQTQDQRLFMVTFLIMITGHTKQELDTNILQTKSIAQQHSCNLIRLDYEQENALMSSLPIADNFIKIDQALTTAATAIMVPFTTQELFQRGGDAVYSGLNAKSGNMIFLDRKRLKTPNGLILGTPGSGKSFTTKREIYSVYLVTDDDIIVCDPESEYTALVESLKGQVLKISPTSTQFINPMDINQNYSEEDNPIALKSDFILSFCELILGDRNGLQPIEKTVIDRCVHAVYDRYFLDPVPEKMPILEDLYNELLTQSEHEARRVATALELYVNGSLNVFNHRTNVDVSKRVVCYDIKDLGKQLKKLGMLIVQDQVWNRVTVNRYQKKTTRYFIDEFHLLLREEQTAAYSVEIWKRFRKWGGIPTGITQNIKDLLRSQEIENIFENSEYICMLNQAAEDRRILAEHLGINSQQLQFVTKVGEGQGLIFYGSVIVPFVDHFPKNTRMYRIMTTKLSETSGESGSAPVKKLLGAKPKPSGQSGSGSIATIQSGSGSIATMDQPASDTDAFESVSNPADQESEPSEQVIKEVQEVNSDEQMVEEIQEEDPFEQMIREVRDEGSLEKEIKEVQEEGSLEQEKDTTTKAAPKRRRGRPSKKELEARRAEESAAGAETEKSDSMPAEDGAVRAEKENTEPEAEDHESEGKEITPASAPIKKKRGRPSKKEIAERKAAEESQAAGE